MAERIRSLAQPVARLGHARWRPDPGARPGGRRLPDRPRLRAWPQRRSLRHGQGPGRELRHRRPGRLAAAHHRDRRRPRPRSGADRPRSVDRHQVPYGARDRAGGDPAPARRSHRSARPALPAGRRRRQPVHRRPDDHRAHRVRSIASPGSTSRPESWSSAASSWPIPAGRPTCSPGSTRSSRSCSRRRPAMHAFRPSSSPPIPAARSPRSGAPRRACSRSCRAIPRPVSWRRTRWTRRSGWSVRSSTGWPTDAPGDGQAPSYGRQNGLSYSAQASARVSPMSRSM